MPSPDLLTSASAFAEIFPVADAFEERIRSTGLGTVWMTLVAFLVTFVITRTITHMIKAGKGPFGDISVGGTHLHHLVPGIFLLLISGVIGIAIDWQPGGAAALIVPTMFGIGAALTLDEFALWLTLKDVYWEQEGRRSVDAVITLAAVLGLIALGIPFWRDVWVNANVAGSWIISAWHVLAAAFAVVCFLKGKWTLGALGLLVWVFGFIGAVRLARPSSWWARRVYGERSQARADARYPEDRRMPMWFWQRRKKGAAGT
ncbi:MAG: hypothetical protein O3B97_01630 [Actinomycetota bacterium]|nr:hypothetical protein [Thermoleophilia bacterium]MDA3005344.1 hypothetical protein [Actinomycetota bacterium]